VRPKTIGRLRFLTLIISVAFATDGMLQTALAITLSTAGDALASFVSRP
jgi:hypothetical protein